VARRKKDTEQSEPAEDEQVEGWEELTEEELNALIIEAAEVVVNTCMEIRSHENVLIIADPSTSEIGQALYDACQAVSKRVLLVVMPMTRHNGDEPPSPVAELMRRQSVVLAPTRYSLTHTRARIQACNDGARVATMPGMTKEMFARGGMSADFSKIRESINRVAVHLRRRRKIRVTSAEGTDIRFEVDPKRWNKEDSGICNRPGMVTNLPAGKIFIYPDEGTSSGDMVIDGSFDSVLLSEPLRFKVNDGAATDIKGGPEAQRVRHMFAEAANSLPAKSQSGIWKIVQFGIGLNPNSKLIGNALEDEKVLGTCYFSIGSDFGTEGRPQAGIHTSGVIRNPTIIIDGEPLMVSGVLKI